jgi:hypothetical protein
MRRLGDISNFFLPQNSERFLDFARNDKLEKTTPVHIWEQVILCFALREKIAIDAPMRVILSRADGEGSLIVPRRVLGWEIPRRLA